LPYICISEAYTGLIEGINDANKLYFGKYEMKLSYRSKFSTSWLELDLSDEFKYSAADTSGLKIANNQN
jgi:hypothetical protein